MAAQRNRFWKHIAIYSGVIAILLSLSQLARYSLLARDWAQEATVLLVGVPLLVVGFLTGGRWRHRDKPDDQRPLEKPSEIPLTPRELSVLALVAQGLSNQEIADRDCVSVSTVKTHLRNLFGKLEVRRRTQAVDKARRLGLLVEQSGQQ